MSIDTLDSRDGRSCLIDTTTGLAFGPVFDRDVPAEHVLEYITQYMRRDARTMSAAELRRVSEEIAGMDPLEYNDRVA